MKLDFVTKSFTLNAIIIVIIKMIIMMQFIYSWLYDELEKIKANFTLITIAETSEMNSTQINYVQLGQIYSNPFKLLILILNSL